MIPSVHVKPSRLLREADRWVLEFECLVPVGNRILRPERHAVAGTGAILAWLGDQAADPSLLDGAARLLHSENPGNPYGYEIQQGRWVPAAPREGDPRERTRIDQGSSRVVPEDPPRPQHPVAAPADLVLCRQEIAALTRTHERLIARLATMETHLAEILTAVRSGSFTREDHTTPAVQPPRPSASTPNVPVTAHVDPEVQHPAARAQPEPEPARPVLRLPPARVIAINLRKLLGDNKYSVLETPRKSITRITLETREHYVSTLIDKSGEEVGAMIADLRSTIWLGSALMMLPARDVEEQWQARVPTEDVISAYSEICNTLSGQLNAIPGNLHVRTTPLAPLDVAARPWIIQPASRLDLDDSCGGKLIFMTR